MEEKLRQKKLFIKLLSFFTVAIFLIIVFIPLFEMSKTVELLGIKETITAKFSIWQIIVQDEQVALNSVSALGEFEEFDTIAMQELFGGKKMALFSTLSLIALAIPFVVYGIAVFFKALLNDVQRTTIKNFVLSAFLFTVFPVFILSVVEMDNEFALTVPILFIIILAIFVFVILEFFSKLIGDISAFSTEMFLRKYKKEDKKWFKVFVEDIMDYFHNASIPMEVEAIVKIIDTQDRNELRKTKKKEQLSEEDLEEEE